MGLSFLKHVLLMYFNTPFRFLILQLLIVVLFGGSILLCLINQSRQGHEPLQGIRSAKISRQDDMYLHV